MHLSMCQTLELAPGKGLDSGALAPDVQDVDISKAPTTDGNISHEPFGVL